MTGNCPQVDLSANGVSWLVRGLYRVNQESTGLHVYIYIQYMTAVSDIGNDYHPVMLNYEPAVID